MGPNAVAIWRRRLNALSTIATRASGWRTAATERRLHRRAASYWHSLRDGTDVPLLKDFDFTISEEFASRGFLVHIDKDGPVLSHVGEILMDEAELASPLVALADVPAKSLLGQFGRRYAQALVERIPVTTEHVFDTDAGYRISCRSVLLPFRGAGDMIDHVYGVVSWKSEKIEKSENATLAFSVGE